MKFIIFNIIVFCSLGYLLTSKPNENLNQWLGNTKNKLSNITSTDVTATIKKAVSKNTATEKVISEKNKETNKIKNVKDKNNDFKIREIINKILVEKNKKEYKNDFDDIKAENEITIPKASKLNNTKVSNKTFTPKASELTYPKSVVIVKNIEPKKIKTSNNFMTYQERENALAELITDMELYHLNGFTN